MLEQLFSLYNTKGNEEIYTVFGVSLLIGLILAALKPDFSFEYFFLNARLQEIEMKEKLEIWKTKSYNLCRFPEKFHSTCSMQIWRTFIRVCNTKSATIIISSDFWKKKIVLRPKTSCNCLCVCFLSHSRNMWMYLFPSVNRKSNAKN